MITLCGITLSNYYNKVKLVLLEKGIPFTEERVATGSKDEAVLAVDEHVLVGGDGAVDPGRTGHARDAECARQYHCVRGGTAVGEDERLDPAGAQGDQLGRCQRRGDASGRSLERRRLAGHSAARERPWRAVGAALEIEDWTLAHREGSP